MGLSHLNSPKKLNSGSSTFTSTPTKETNAGSSHLFTPLQITLLQQSAVMMPTPGSSTVRRRLLYEGGDDVGYSQCTPSDKSAIVVFGHSSNANAQGISKRLFEPSTSHASNTSSRLDVSADDSELNDKDYEDDDGANGSPILKSHHKSISQHQKQTTGRKKKQRSFPGKVTHNTLTKKNRTISAPSHNNFVIPMSLRFDGSDSE
jgi:hypothetical protein